MSSTLLARQAIYDCNKNVYAYELLFRAHGDEAATIIDGDHATSTVLINAFTSLPVEEILEDKPAFVNFTRNLLDNPPPIDASRLVVEILENVAVDADMIAAVKALKANGYAIALDDYVYVDGHEELIQLADLIKIDMLAQSLEQVRDLLTRLDNFNGKLLAEKVETQEIFETCKQLGFQLFQGYFLAKPQIVKGRALKSDQRTVLQLLSALSKPDAEFSDIAQVIQTDSVLTLKVLRLINSALFNPRREITSVRQAVTMLGMGRVRSWAHLLSLTKLDNQPQDLFTTTMVRARFGQLLAERAKAAKVQGESQFTIGLLSTLDAFLGIELAEILSSVNVPDSMRAAILQRRGSDGLLHAVTLAYERADWDSIDWHSLNALGINAEQAQAAYLESLQWTQMNIALLR
jgi:EAL and modified HD-GYP domain-containing signal transduction protein